MPANLLARGGPACSLFGSERPSASEATHVSLKVSQRGADGRASAPEAQFIKAISVATATPFVSSKLLIAVSLLRLEFYCDIESGF